MAYPELDVPTDRELRIVVGLVLAVDVAVLLVLAVNYAF